MECLNCFTENTFNRQVFVWFTYVCVVTHQEWCSIENVCHMEYILKTTWTVSKEFKRCRRALDSFSLEIHEKGNEKIKKTHTRNQCDFRSQITQKLIELSLFNSGQHTFYSIIDISTNSTRKKKFEMHIDRALTKWFWNWRDWSKRKICDFKSFRWCLSQEA